MSLVETMITDITNFSFDMDFVNSLSTTTATFNSTLEGDIQTILKNTTFGIGASLLGIFMMMELVSIIQRSDSGGSGLQGLHIPANILIKWGIVTFLYCNLGVVLNGVQAVIAQLGQQIGTTNISMNWGSVSNLEDSFNNMPLIPDRAFAIVVLLLEWILYNLFKSLISVMVVFRVFEIWILTVLAPIPLATLPSQEFRQSAINFIKTYVATCLTGTVILLTFLIYSKLMPTHFAQMVNTYTDPITGTVIALPLDGITFCQKMLKNFMYLIVLVVVTFNAGRISKSLVNAI